MVNASVTADSCVVVKPIRSDENTRLLLITRYLTSSNHDGNIELSDGRREGTARGGQGSPGYAAKRGAFAAKRGTIAQSYRPAGAGAAL